MSDNCKKIHIVTLGAKYMFSNAGTFLQHWALRKKLSEMGHLPYRVVYENDKKNISINRFVFFIYFLLRVVKVLFYYIGLSKYLKSGEYNVLSFRDFVQANLFRKCFVDKIGDCLENTNLKPDVLILGGDQVMDIIYLSFVNKKEYTKCISYSASTDWQKKIKSDTWKEVMSSILQNFARVGVREFTGVDCLAKIGIDAVKVADPVMLVTSKELELFAGNKQIFKNPSTFVYLLNIQEKSELNLEELVTISNSLETELKIHGIQGAQYLIPNKYYLHLDPSQFVRAIIDSKFFITNSYHGTVVALIFHKPFVSIVQDSPDVITQNIRQKELLELVGLQHHRIKMSEFENKGQLLLNDNIDWEKIDKIIEEFRIFSLDWLREAIEV